MEPNKQIYNKLIELFPVDIVNIMLLYSEKSLIIQLQNYFPILLKHLTIIGKELQIINVHNYKYIKKFDSSNCLRCPNIIDESIMNLVN